MSAKRKPVPKMEPLPTTTTSQMSTPPRYILEVAPPSYAIDIECGVPTARSAEDLPIYNEENATEPKTLARSCWLWGFIFPLLWLIGLCM